MANKLEDNSKKGIFLEKDSKFFITCSQQKVVAFYSIRGKRDKSEEKKKK